MEAIYITDGFGARKLIGRRFGDTYYTWRKYETHFFRKYKGWAIDIEILNREDITHYTLHDSTGKFDEETGKYIVKPAEYYATKQDFLDNGIRMNHLGHGEQICLPLKFWRKYELISDEQ